MINPLKGGKTSNLAKNYNFSIILYQFIGFFRVKKAYFGGFAPISMNIWLFRVKYYIKPPKNHWRLNTGNSCTDISHLGELDMAYFAKSAIEGEKMSRMSKDKVSETLKSWFRLFSAKLSIKTHESLLKLHIYP